MNKKFFISILFILFLFPPLLTIDGKEPQLIMIEWSLEKVDGSSSTTSIPSYDNSMENPNYKLLPFRLKTTTGYYINPSNKYGFKTEDIVAVINAAANTWDQETSFQLFKYMGITSRSAGKRDGYNVISWGAYKAGVIAVTYIWYVGDTIIEVDTKLNTFYKWSLNGEPGKMDLQNIMTHEFGHWCGLDDLYNDGDYWLTMYGYANLGETYKRTLGLGDILGLKAIYGG